MSFPILRSMVAVALSMLVVGACVPAPDIETRTVGSLLDPYCMPDGSVVRYQFSDTEGKYEGTKGDRANCPWNKNKK